MTNPPVVPMVPDRATSSWMAVEKSIRSHLVGYSTTDNVYLSNFLEKIPRTEEPGLYRVRAPDDRAFPYATMRLEADNLGTNQGMRMNGTLEVLLYGRPWTQRELVENAADLIEQAMYHLLVNTDGLIFCHGKTRATLPPGTDPSDSEVCTVRLTFTLAIWPQYLTRLGTILPE